jgi:hypothetical protein
MNTDSIPRKKSDKEEYLRSDTLRTLELPPPEPARSYANDLKIALSAENRKDVQKACNELLEVFAAFYTVEKPTVKILSVRPRQVSARWVQELFGDYDPETFKIRLWMRTAVQKKATSYGTLLSTLCHEFCHHLDMVSLDLVNSYHTRGFYDRAGLLYHHVQNTPVRNIVWTPQANGTYRVDWGKTMAANKVN